ncbi:MAG: putative glycosyl hydrolase, family 13 [Ilumatobacteraceae bacterium]|nr:putative glycosyl hydrolase, family 13 [Ilumatobacteraceae bacterium]
MEEAHEPAWWQTKVVYQIYPRSFADSNADGIGDLQGIRSRLGHLQWLGIEVLWLSPVFRSPMADFGYDVSDYCDIDPVFGTLADMDALIADCHSRGMRLMLDWVPNHTSDQHPWFVESRSSRDNARADWYVWRDEPANNWLASFPQGESAWEHDDVRDQWYLRCFLREQPDLNWDNRDVEAAMHDTLRFWLDRGVDGFRMDVIHLIGKHLDEDDPERAVARGVGHVPFNDVPETHDRIRRIRAVLDSYPGQRACVGEVYLLDEAKMAAYYGDGDELNLSFNFGFLWAAWDATTLRGKITSTLDHLRPRGAWPTWVLSNHDVPRHRQRYGGSEDVARMAAVMLLTLPGTPFVYQGEDLGLIDAVVPPERVVDPGGRDGCRAPIPWNDDPGHGWPHAPWLPFVADAGVSNVGTLDQQPDSILHLYRELLHLRRDHAALQSGQFTMIERTDDVIAYTRTPTDPADTRAYTIALNLGEGAAVVAELAGGRVLTSTIAGDLTAPADEIVPPHAAVVVLHA